MADSLWEIFNELNKYYTEKQGGVIKLPISKVKKLLADLDNSNARYNYKQFEKLFDNYIKWYGYFDNGKLTALAAIRPEEYHSNYINEIQAFKPGYGKKLLEWLFNNLNKVWLMADPESTDKLKNYYRQFNLTELKLMSNVYNKEISMFLDKAAAEDEQLVDHIKYWYSGEEAK